MSAHLDSRLTAARPDLAAAHLRGRVNAARFVEGRPFEIRAPSAPVRRQPQADARLDTEALRGEAVSVYEEIEGWCWAQLAADTYVGWLPADALAARSVEPPTHKVAALRSFLFPGPDIKLPPLAALPFGASVRVEAETGDFARLADGFVWSRHLVERTSVEPDFVAVAERFVGVPYLWGGKTALGIDCSGLVQTALGAAGRAAPRDSDMQERQLGQPVEGHAFRRGDLVFWRGHVGVMRDAQTLLHANGYALAVTVEPLAMARERIASSGGGPISSVRRLL